MQLAVQIADTYDRVLEVARWGEKVGLTAVSLPDHYLYGTSPWSNPAPDALTQIAGLARDTDTIELATLVSPVTFRHPAVFAKTAVTLDRMSGGRFSLGLGTGWMDDEHEVFGFPYPDLATRFAWLEEHLAYVRTAVSPGAGSFTGKHFTLKEVELQPPATHGPKLIVGGAGPKKTPRLAGMYADEFNVFAQPADAMEERIATARQAAEEAGRSADDLLISTACPMVIGATEADYRAALEESAEAFERTPEQIEERFGERGVLIGTVDRFSETLATWKSLGVQRFHMQRLVSGRSLDQAAELVELIREVTAD